MAKQALAMITFCTYLIHHDDLENFVLEKSSASFLHHRKFWDLDQQGVGATLILDDPCFDEHWI